MGQAAHATGMHRFCGFSANEGTPDVLEHSIILSHYGFAGVDTACDAYGWLHNYDHCRRQQRDPHAAGRLPCYNPAKVMLMLTVAMRAHRRCAGREFTTALLDQARLWGCLHVKLCRDTPHAVHGQTSPAWQGVGQASRLPW